MDRGTRASETSPPAASGWPCHITWPRQKVVSKAFQKEMNPPGVKTGWFPYCPMGLGVQVMDRQRRAKPVASPKTKQFRTSKQPMGTMAAASSSSTGPRCASGRLFHQAGPILRSGLSTSLS